MTEEKADIQAQIDQLDDRWKARSDARKGVSRAKGILLFALIFAAVAVVLGYRDLSDFAEFSMYPVIACLVLPFVAYGLKKDGPLRKPLKDYELTIDKYESKRAELQAKLDAASEGERS